MSELKPCPFCGRQVKYKGIVYLQGGMFFGHKAGCSSVRCGWEMYAPTYKKLITRANRRAPIVKEGVE